MKKENFNLNFNLKNICPISINERFEEFYLIVWQESFQSDVQKEQFLSLSLSLSLSLKAHTDCFSLAYVLHLRRRKTTVDRINTN